MDKMRFRQVHLDFHTSPAIPEVGEAFDKAEFQSALRAGHVDSITVFSKCHHGYSYHPTKVNEIHPGLGYDLLGAQLQACAEIGVRAPVYISAGFDEKYAVKHPEHLVRSAPDQGIGFDAPGYHLICFNTPYLGLLSAQVREVLEVYHPVEIFLDICSIRECRCAYCVESMKRKGYDPDDPRDERNGFVTGIRCVRMELGEPDAGGRRRPVEIPDSEFELHVDTVVMAIGTSPNPLIKSTTEGLETQKWGGIIVDEATGLTSREGVYAGGDAVTGAATVILAMGAGKTAASAIDQYLQNK